MRNGLRTQESCVGWTGLMVSLQHVKRYNKVHTPLDIVGTHCQLFRWKRILIILGFYDHQIFIPVHEGNDLDGHWILLVVYVKRGITELWDSAGGARLTDGRHAMIQQVVISIL